MSLVNRRFPFAHAFSQLLRVLLPVAVIMISAASAGAQSEPGIGEGAKIRVQLPGSKEFQGIVKSRTADSTTMFVEGYGATKSFLNSDVTKMKVSRGRTHLEGAKKGAIWGAGIGGILAIAVLATPAGDKDYEYSSDSNAQIATSTFLGSMVWGIGLGALVKAEQWENVAVHPHFAVAPASGGVGVSVAFSPSFLH